MKIDKKTRCNAKKIKEHEEETQTRFVDIVTMMDSPDPIGTQNKVIIIAIYTRERGCS